MAGDSSRSGSTPLEGIRGGDNPSTSRGTRGTSVEEYRRRAAMIQYVRIESARELDNMKLDHRLTREGFPTWDRIKSDEELPSVSRRLTVRRFPSWGEIEPNKSAPPEVLPQASLQLEQRLPDSEAAPPASPPWKALSPSNEDTSEREPTPVAGPSRQGDLREGASSDKSDEYIDKLLNNFNSEKAKNLLESCRSLLISKKNKRGYSDACKSKLKETRHHANIVHRFTSLPDKDYQHSQTTSRKDARESMRVLSIEYIENVQKQLSDEGWHPRHPFPIQAFIDEIKRIEGGNPGTSRS